MHIEKNPLKGIFICLISYFFISLIGLCEKSISHTISLSTILFFQNGICLLLMIPSIIKNDVKSLMPTNLNTYTIRIVSGLGCYAALFYIIRFIPISEALLYQYSASLWIPFIMVIWLNVRMPKKLWSGIIIGFIGIILILKPSRSTLSIISLIGIICGILQGISMVAIRKLSSDEPIIRILFYYFLIGTIVMAPWAIKNWLPIKQIDLIFLVGVGVSTYIAQKLLAISLCYAHPSTLAPVCYTSILYSGLFGWFFWHEVPHSTTFTGMALVISGCIVTIYMNRPSAKSLEQLPADNPG